ncbi:carboxylesterase, partial [Pseudoloma neurophilia]
TEKDEQKNTGVKNIIVKYLRSSYKQILAVTYIIFFIILSQIVCFQNQIIFLTPHDSSEKISGNMVQIERKDGTNLVISICENLSNIDLVFFHGRGASNRVHNKITKKLSKYNTISFFWPGYLQNNFLINKKSFKSDLEIFTDYLKKRKSIRNNKIFILGQSFGCNFALFTSKILNVPVILENPFYCLQSTILTSRFFFLSYFLIYNYDNSKYITDIKNKKHVLAILSGKEELFSKSQVKKVKKLLDENKIENIGISEAKHHDVGKFEEFYTAVHNFISSS